MHSGIKYNLTKIKDHIPRNIASHGPIANAILQYKSLSPDVQFHQIWSCINLCITSRLDTNSHIYVWMYGLEKGHKNRLREPNAHGRFSVIFTKEISFVTFCLVIPSNKPFLKEVCFWKERICSPRGANSYLLEQTHFQKRNKTVLTVISSWGKIDLQYLSWVGLLGLARPSTTE